MSHFYLYLLGQIIKNDLIIIIINYNSVIKSAPGVSLNDFNSFSYSPFPESLW